MEMAPSCDGAGSMVSALSYHMARHAASSIPRHAASSMPRHAASSMPRHAASSMLRHAASSMLCHAASSMVVCHGGMSCSQLHGMYGGMSWVVVIGGWGWIWGTPPPLQPPQPHPLIRLSTPAHVTNELAREKYSNQFASDWNKIKLLIFSVHFTGAPSY